MSDRAHSIDDFPGLSSDQFYRRVKLLESADLLSTFRGKSNRILISEPDSRTLSRFLAIEQNNPDAGLQWCLERLRFEVEHERAEELQNNLTYVHTEVKQLRNALVRYRRHPLRRLWRRMMQMGSGFKRLRRGSAERNETNAES